MQNKALKKIDNGLGYNSANAKQIFIILEELKDGYLYAQADKQFSPVSYVPKDQVLVEEKKTKDVK